MATDSVGQIGLDLVVNDKSFKKQMNGIQGMAKKAGAALAAAFAVKKLVDFGKSCIDLGSDLAEVQNVVDVTFPSMSKQVDAFSQKAATSFGLSETMAKKFTGTFGAMSKAFGFNEQAAYEMSTALTGLSGDVASFYNISQDEAYTKLKSVFTGETESLKDLGVVMTQSALDQYALANGFGKTTTAMSEAEKVSLRYKFVMDQLSLASGDFIRTSSGWANQVRILKLQFDSLKATIGQGLINVLTPVLKAINLLILRLMTLANAFKSFTELVFGSGGKAGTTQLAETAEGIEASAGAADSLADSTGKAGSAAKKAAKEMRNLMGFDQISKLSSQDDANTGTDGSGGIGGTAVDFGSVTNDGETALDKLDSKFQGLINRCKELKKMFSNGFFAGFGDGEKRFQSFQYHIENIGKSLKEIFTDKDLQSSSKGWLDSVATNVGKVAGSIASVGVTIADNLLGGVDKYIQKSKDYIKKRIISIFDVSSEIWKLNGDFAAAFADTFSVFSEKSAKQCTSSIIGIFSDGFLGILDLSLKLSRDILANITKPFIDNKDKIKEAINNTLGPISEVLERLHGSVKETFEKLNEVYDKSVKPMFDSFGKGISDILEKLLDGYNNHIALVLDSLAEKFSEVWTKHVQPAIDNAIELFGKIADGIREIWEKSLQPFLAWCAEHIMPVLAPILKQLGEDFLNTLAVVADVATGLIKALGGVIDFITGVFTGDWSKAWEGIKTIFKGVWESLVALLKTPINSIINFLNRLISGVANAINSVARTLNNIKIDIPEWLGGGTLGLKIPTVSAYKIPALAQGGYVKANTPQLAMIGDNRTQGEIVAPESKLLEMAKMAAGSGNPELQTLLREILSLLKSMNLVALDDESMRKYFIKKTNSNTLARGKSELISI